MQVQKQDKAFHSKGFRRPIIEILEDLRQLPDRFIKSKVLKGNRVEGQPNRLYPVGQLHEIA